MTATIFNSSCSSDVCELLVKLNSALASGNNSVIQIILKKIESKGCKCPVAFNNYANFLLNKNNLNEAEKYFKKALENDPQYPYALFGLSILYDRKGHKNLENEYLWKTLMVDPNHSEAHFNLAINFQDKGDLEASEKEYRKVLDTNPKHIRARQNLALLFSRTTRCEEAVKLLEKGMELNPEEKAKTLSFMIICLNNGGKDSEVEEKLKELKMLSPKWYKQVKEELSEISKQSDEIQQKVNEANESKDIYFYEQPKYPIEDSEAERGIISFIRNRSVIHNEMKLKPLEQIYTRVLCKYENLNAKIVPAGQCPCCKKIARNEPVYEETGHFKAVLKKLIRYWGTPLREVPTLTCCGASFSATWLEEYQGPDLMYRVPIGSYLVPVVNNSDKYPVTVNEVEARQLEELKLKQSVLFDEKEEEWKRAVGDFIMENWNKVVKGFSAQWHEHCHAAMLEEALSHDLLGIAITKKELMEMKKNLLRTSPKIYRVFYMIPVLGYLLNALPSEAENGLRWNIKFHKMQVGKVLLEQGILTFPLIEELEWMRIEALNELGLSNNIQMKVIIDRVNTLEKKLQEKQQSVDSLTKQIKDIQQRETKLKQTIDKLTSENKSLKEMPSTAEHFKSQRGKIMQFKAMIGEMQEFIKSLPQESIEQPVNFDEQDIITPEKDEIFNVDDILSTKVVGIIGGFSDQLKLYKPNTCGIITATGRNLDDVKQLVDKSDVIVVLTQHVSHAAMWSAKESAIDCDKPIVFSKHENISIILNDAAAALV
jgi:tetratricopeptide (TPR) repeat protein